MKRKTKKSSKRRAHTTHGYGSMKKNRGAGNRGGVGMAGTGKKADSKVSSINPKTYFGKYGFTSKVRQKSAISVYELSKSLSELEAKEVVKKDGEVLSIDLTKAGIDKLIATGKVHRKFNIKVAAASPRAVEKIEKAGGKVEVLSKESSKTEASA
jgi:large subunit ribosomal protein L15